MKRLLALASLALASPAVASSDAMSAWAKCMSNYALPRLKTEPTVKIVDGAMAVCLRQENAEHQALVRENGPVGHEMFRGIRHQVREHMIAIVTLGKRQRGYK